MKILASVWKFIKSFMLFWQDFLVGDSPELALGVLIILGVAYLLHNSGILDVIAIIVLALVLMIATVWRKTRHHS
jgi:hypothetical protein